MLILGQNDIFCGHHVANFSVCFLQLTVFKYLVASHVTEPGSLLTEPGAVIKFSHFAVTPVHVCYKYINTYIKRILWSNHANDFASTTMSAAPHRACFCLISQDVFFIKLCILYMSGCNFLKFICRFYHPTLSCGLRRFVVHSGMHIHPWWKSLPLSGATSSA